MKRCFGRRDGQTMVEYILIVVLIAVGLLFFFGKFSKAVGTKVAGATSAIDADAGSEAQSKVDELDSEDRIKNFSKDGSFN